MDGQFKNHVNYGNAVIFYQPHEGFKGGRVMWFGGEWIKKKLYC